MAYEARIERDSVNVATGQRITTFVVTYPRFVHSELLTHRVFSRNSASSRAIPFAKLRQRVQLSRRVDSVQRANRRDLTHRKARA